MRSDYDILIAGGGMVGASLARALAGTGLRIGVIEAWSFDAEAQPSYDERVIALSWGSRRIMDGMGLWPLLQAEAEPISDIHISDRGHFGCARLNSRQERVEALGYVASARAMGAALQRALQGQADLEWLCPARLLSLSQADASIEVRIEQAGERRRVTARLLVAADGGDSLVRSLLTIPLQERRYGQTAIIANLTPGRPHRGVAYERFTDSGPLAMLPMSGGRCSLVWSARDEQLAELMALDDAAFLQRLQRRFGYRLGRLQRIGRRTAYPLRYRQASESVRPRVVLIGNAAHAIHPVTGQGYNLGLRDVAVLADLLADAARSGDDPGAMALLDRYAGQRRQDQRRVALITDGLARLFANPFGPLRLARNLGLLGLDACPSLKHLVAQQFMGLNGPLPRLARGIPLR